MKKCSWIYLSIQERRVNFSTCLNHFKGAFFLQTCDLWPCNPHRVVRRAQTWECRVLNPIPPHPLWLEPASSSWTSHISSLSLSFPIYKGNWATRSPSLLLPDIWQSCLPKEEILSCTSPPPLTRHCMSQPSLQPRPTQWTAGPAKVAWSSEAQSSQVYSWVQMIARQPSLPPHVTVSSSFAQNNELIKGEASRENPLKIRSCTHQEGGDELTQAIFGNSVSTGIRKAKNRRNYTKTLYSHEKFLS